MSSAPIAKKKQVFGTGKSTFGSSGNVGTIVMKKPTAKASPAPQAATPTAKAPAPTSTTSQVSTIKKTSSPAPNPSGLSNVVDTFKLIGMRTGNALLPGQPFGDTSFRGSSPTLQDKFTSAVTNPVTVFGAPLAYTVAAMWGATTTAATAAKTAVTGGALAKIGSTIKNPLTTFVVGAAAGALVSNVNDKPNVLQAAPQAAAPQTQQPTIYTYTDSGGNVSNTNTDNRQYNRSTNTQNVNNTMINSPYGSIGGSGFAAPFSPSLTSSVIPSMNIPTNVEPVQDMAQNQQQEQGLSASSGISWITVALIGLGLYALSKR